jgi:hypothetical protein
MASRVFATDLSIPLPFSGGPDMPIALWTPHRLIVGFELHERQGLCGRERIATDFRGAQLIERGCRISIRKNEAGLEDFDRILVVTKVFHVVVSK